MISSETKNWPHSCLHYLPSNNWSQGYIMPHPFILPPSTQQKWRVKCKLCNARIGQLISLCFANPSLTSEKPLEVKCHSQTKRSCFRWGGFFCYDHHCYCIHLLGFYYISNFLPATLFLLSPNNSNNSRHYYNIYLRSNWEKWTSVN